MASFDLPEIPQPRVSPALLVGVASPLWSYFGAAAAGGMAYWWMTRWARPVNLEAMLAMATSPATTAALAPIAEAAEQAVDTVIETQAAFADAVLEDAPVAVGGEAAPVGPLDAAMAEPEPEAEVVFAVAPEPVIDEPTPVWAEAASAETAPKSRAKKTAPPAFETDADA